MQTSDRFVTAMIAATICYLAVEYVIQKRERFAVWRASFLAPFTDHPGKREFLRNMWTREEMNIRERAPVLSPDTDCGCDA